MAAMGSGMGMLIMMMTSSAWIRNKIDINNPTHGMRPQLEQSSGTLRIVIICLSAIISRCSESFGLAVFRYYALQQPSLV